MSCGSRGPVASIEKAPIDSSTGAVDEPFDRDRSPRCLLTTDSVSTHKTCGVLL